MIDSTTLVSFGLAAAVLVIMPGPATMYIVTRSLDQGRQAGLASVLGISVGAIAHFIAAGLGLSAILMTSATAFSAVKYAGALYLIYLGIQKLCSNGALLINQSAIKAPLLTIFCQGIVVNVLNPKAAIFALAFLPQFIDPTGGPVWQQLTQLCLVFITIGFLSDSTYATLAGQMRHWIVRHPKFLQRQKYVTGGTYIALGMAAATVGPAQK
ncbi:MAG: LysE family translocator [Phormidesmis sp.]